MNKKIAVVIGTARTGRATEKVAAAVCHTIQALPTVQPILVDVKDHIKEAVTTPPWGAGGADEQPTAWKEIVSQAHALILVVPEYNHSFPGELKLLLDSLWDEYKNKAVGLVGVSAGTLGAARVVDHIKPVLIELKLHPVKEAVHISKVGEAVTETGVFSNEKTVEYLEHMVHEISWLSTALQSAKR